MARIAEWEGMWELFFCYCLCVTATGLSSPVLHKIKKQTSSYSKPTLPWDMQSLGLIWVLFGEWYMEMVDGVGGDYNPTASEYTCAINRYVRITCEPVVDACVQYRKKKQTSDPTHALLLALVRQTSGKYFTRMYKGCGTFFLFCYVSSFKREKEWHESLLHVQNKTFTQLAAFSGRIFLPYGNTLLFSHFSTTTIVLLPVGAKALSPDPYSRRKLYHCTEPRLPYFLITYVQLDPQNIYRRCSFLPSSANPIIH